MTTRERMEAASPLEKFEVLSDAVDRLRAKIEEIEGQQSVDDLLESVPLDELAQQYNVPVRALRDKLIAAGGEIFKIGKRSFIRKVRLLAVLEKLEQA